MHAFQSLNQLIGSGYNLLHHGDFQVNPDSFFDWFLIKMVKRNIFTGKVFLPESVKVAEAALKWNFSFESEIYSLSESDLACVVGDLAMESGRGLSWIQLKEF